MTTSINLGPLSNFEPGRLHRVEAPERALAFAVVVTPEGTVHVIDDLCTHANARLSEGWLEEGCVACPWHGAQFDMETGRAISLPATGFVPTHQPIVKDGTLFVNVTNDNSSEGLDETDLNG